MDPVLSAGSVVLLDRHFNSLIPNQPSQPNIYAVNVSNTLTFRYVSYDANCLVLRPHALNYPVELLKLSGEESPSSYVVGRVCVLITAL
jgi:hypothetical protein